MSVLFQPDSSLVTAEDLERLAVQGHRYELIRGELIAMTPAGFPHGNATERIAARATVFVEDNDLGECSSAETGFCIARNPDTVLAPDWAFVAKERLPNPVPEGFLPIAPDIVLETRSPGDTPREVALKVERWLQAGVRIVWEFHPAAGVLTVHRAHQLPRMLGPDDILSGEEVLPGFELPLQRVFREPGARP